MQVALYGRVSPRPSQADRDPENQLLRLREFAAKQEWNIVVEYVDRASGGKADREQFQAMMAAASRREFDLVLFWSLDRLSREGVLETLQHLQRLIGWGVGWRSYTEQYLDSTGMFREAVIAILASIAKQERVRASERMHAWIAKRRQAGLRVGRQRIEDANPQLAARVTRLRAEGNSLRKIANDTGLAVRTVMRLAREEAPAAKETSFSTGIHRQANSFSLDEKDVL